MCGSFSASRNALELKNSPSLNALTPVQSAVLSHAIRRTQASGKQSPLITTDWLALFIKDASLPTPSEQVRNLVRFVGDDVATTGVPLSGIPTTLWTYVGSPNPDACYRIAKQIWHKGILLGTLVEDHGGISGDIRNLDLSLDGWDMHQKEKTGRLSGSYGFMALKFGDAILDDVLASAIKPAIRQMGYSLVDMRDVAQPGLIDNIMREKIRDAAFVLVDLTHDNSGAYWEAGYAEGLGKPVLYLCETTKFDEKKTHFDTNHCTTLTWGGTKSSEQFGEELRATLANSMRLVPTS
jgi:hypothetical protein